MRRTIFLIAAAAFLAAACQGRPLTPAPLPAGFAVQTLSGQRLTPQQMRGTAWVVNFWLPT
jgi:hypothetical protein